MQLYKVPKHSVVKILDEKVQVAPDSLQLVKGDIIWYGHIDGMYSFCTMKKKGEKGEDKNEYVYPVAWAEVEVLEANEDGEWEADPRIDVENWE